MGRYIILTVIFFSVNIKNNLIERKKISPIIFFAAFLINFYFFPMKLWQISAFCDIFDVLWISMDGIWSKNTLSKSWIFPKIVKFWIFLIFYMHSYFWFEQLPLIMGKSGAFNIRLTSEVCFRGCLLSVIGLENRGFGVFQNLLYRQGIAACVAHLGTNLMS